MSTATHIQNTFLNTTNESSIRGKFISRLRMLGLQFLLASIAVFGLQVGGASFASATTLAVTSVSPNSGPIEGGTEITITGSGFVNTGNDIKVNIGGASATNIVVVNSTTITADTPVGSLGLSDISVEVNNDGSPVGAFIYRYYGIEPGSVGGSTKFNYTVSAGNVLKIEKKPAVTTPLSVGADAATFGASYNSGDDITGAVAGEHLEIYEVDLNDEVVAAFDITLTSSDIKSAAIANVDVAGTAGSAITSVEAVVTLTGDTFKVIALNADLAAWVTNEPSGITVTAKTAVADGDATVTLVFAGTPAAALSAAMAITIPSAVLNGGANLAVTANANAKFTVAAAFTTYAITITTPTLVSGDTTSTVTSDVATAAAGATVTLTVTPKSGMRLKAGTLVATAGGAGVTLTGSGPYTFTMPSSAVSVASEFEAIPASAPAPAPAAVTLATQSAITVSVPASLEVGKTATLTTTGGADTGTNNFLSNSPTICTVTGAGVVTAVAAGTCSVYAQRTASGFTTAVSADVTFKVMSAAEVKAVADAAAKAAADKAAADALAAAEKVAADKAAAEAKAKEAAEKAAAEAARVEAVRLAGLNTVGNIKTVKGKTSISMNLADKYYAYILELQVRTVVKGKARFTTIEYFAVEREDGVVTVSTRAKIAKGQQMRVLSDGKVVRTFIR